MKQTIAYKTTKGKFDIDYDDEQSCEICGEPVVGASMGGTAICPWCDCGKCRYCDKPIFVIRESIDGGASKRKLLAHMSEHRRTQPDLNEKLLRSHRIMSSFFAYHKVKINEELGVGGIMDE